MLQSKQALLEEVLGPGFATGQGNVQFKCPFCNHKKQKLAVKLSTERWHCWVCETKGRSLYSLFIRVGVSKEKLLKLSKISDVYQSSRSAEVETQPSIVQLPEDFKPLYVVDSKNFFWKKAVEYLTSQRGLEVSDFVKYNIGYCDEGPWKGFIIFPNYDEDGTLNYFTTRSFLPQASNFKNPVVARRDVVGFELQVNWQMPVVLVEGALDAIAVKYNATPLYGKVINNGLKRKILQCGTPAVYLALDGDALKSSIRALQYFLGIGIDVYLVPIQDGQDPSKLGTQQMMKLIKGSTKVDSQQLLQLQITQALC